MYIEYIRYIYIYIRGNVSNDIYLVICCVKTSLQEKFDFLVAG